MAPNPKDLDQSPDARTPSIGEYAPIGAVTIMKVCDISIRFPEAKVHEVATMCGVHRHLVTRALSTPMAQARMSSAYDVRPLVAERLKSQALNAFELLSKVQLRALEDLENDDKVPDSALLAAATRTSLETLKGVGILKDHSIEETKPLDTEGVANLLDKADALRNELETKMKVRMQDVAEAEVVSIEDVTEESSENDRETEETA